MKIAFKIATSDLAKAALMIENQFILVSDILPLLENISIAEESGGSDTFIYLTMNKLIQSAGKLDTGTFTASSDWQVLDNTNAETWSGFNLSVTINKFVKGKTYLIPADQFAPLNMVPNFINVLIANTGSVFAGTTFMYQAGEDCNILNDVDIPNCITVDHNSFVALQIKEVKQQVKKRELHNIMTSTGTPAQIATAVLNPQLPAPPQDMTPAGGNSLVRI